MKDFNFKEKKVVKDEDILKYKNFDEVLTKHKTITKSYNTINKIWGGIILTSIIGVISFYNLKNETTPSKTIKTVEHKTKLYNNPHAEKIFVKSSEIEKPYAVKLLNIEEKKHSVELKKTILKEEDIPEDDPDNIIKEDSTVPTKNTEETLEDYYHLQQKTEQERIKLPTLFLAGKAWPSLVKKRDLIKQSNITAAYSDINKEVPIISYSMMRIDPLDFKKENSKILNNDGRHSASILREAHRSKSGEFIIYKNIIVFIPGIGRYNMGDLKIEVADDKTYNKRLREINNLQKKK